MSDQTPVRLPEERIAEMQRRRESLLAIQTWRSIQRSDLDRVLADVGDLLSDRAAILRELEEAKVAINYLRPFSDEASERSDD